MKENTKNFMINLILPIKELHTKCIFLLKTKCFEIFFQIFGIFEIPLIIWFQFFAGRTQSTTAIKGIYDFCPQKSCLSLPFDKCLHNQVKEAP